MSGHDAREIRVLRDLEYAEHLRTEIDAAQRRIWCHLFSVTPLPGEDSSFIVRSLLQRLARAAARGVDVRVLVGGHGMALPHTPVGNDEAVGFLGGMGVEGRVFEGASRQRSHAKYVLVDDDRVIVGSHHWSPRSLGIGGDTSVSLRSSDLHLLLSRRLVQAWNAAPPRPIPAPAVSVETLLREEWPHLPSIDAPPPTTQGTVLGDGEVILLVDRDYLRTVLQAIKRAKKRVDISMFYFSTSSDARRPTSLLRDAVIAASGRGVKITVLLDDDGGGQRYGSRVINGPVMQALKKAGVTARFDPVASVNHTKAAVIDDDLTFLGSHNWTNNSLHWLHEISVGIRSAEVAAHMRSTFSLPRKSERAPAGARRKRQRVPEHA